MYNTSKLIVDTVRMKGDRIAFSVDNEDITYTDHTFGVATIYTGIKS